MKIPEKAIEAAAQALLLDAPAYRGIDPRQLPADWWEQVTPHRRMDYLHEAQSAISAATPLLREEWEKEQLEAMLDADGPILLGLREAFGLEVISRGWSDEEGDPLNFNGADVEDAGNRLSDCVRDAILVAWEAIG